MIEKLGITKGYYCTESGTGMPTAARSEWIESEEMKRLKDAAPEMLEALISLQVFADSEYNTEISETYYKEIIEKSTGKSWTEIKALLNE